MELSFKSLKHPQQISWRKEAQRTDSLSDVSGESSFKMADRHGMQRIELEPDLEDRRKPLYNALVLTTAK